MNRRIAVSLFVGTLVSIIGLYLAFRNVPFLELYRYIKSINYFWTIPAAMVVILSFLLRALRWRLMLTISQPVSFWEAFHPLMTGFMINCVLPGRVGEVARPVITQKNSGIPFPAGIASVAAERIFDVVILLGLFAGLVMNMEFDRSAEVAFGGITLDKAMLDRATLGVVQVFAVLIAGITVICIPRFRKKIGLGIQKIPAMLFFLGPSGKHFIHERICMPLIAFLDHTAFGFSFLRYPKKVISCAALTCAIWILAAASYFLVAMGCPGISLSLLEFFIVMVIVCFFIVLPSVPGYWGLWEAGGVFALVLFGIDHKDAAGFTLVNHAVQIFPVIVIGFISAVLISVDISRFSWSRKNESTILEGEKI
ncbi:MAG: lysylphosphatidylglycerol synthase transmembrane domain-containing protein [Desulfobacterales bacterium]